jgi:hypothetical protein
MSTPTKSKSSPLGGKRGLDIAQSQVGKDFLKAGAQILKYHNVLRNMS